MTRQGKVAIGSGRNAWCLRSGFTLVELLVVLAVIAILMSLLMPALHKAREEGRNIACANQQRQAGMCINLYMNDYNNFFPPGQISWLNSWQTILNKQGYLTQTALTRCPSAVAVPSSWVIRGYGMNCNAETWKMTDGSRPGLMESTSDPMVPKRLNAVERPTKTVLIAEVACGIMNYYNSGDTLTVYQGQNAFRHRNGMNWTFVDGHVRFRDYASFMMYYQEPFVASFRRMKSMFIGR